MYSSIHWSFLFNAPSLFQSRFFGNGITSFKRTPTPVVMVSVAVTVGVAVSVAVAVMVAVAV